MKLNPVAEMAGKTPKDQPGAAPEEILAQTRARENFYRQIVEQNADAVVVVGDESGQVIFINPAAERLFGRPAPEMTGQIFGFPLGGADPQEIDIWRSNQESIVAEMRVGSGNLGEEKILIVNLRDITKRKQAEKSLRESEEKYRKIIEVSHDAILIIDPATTVILEVNKSAEELFGLTSSQLLGAQYTGLYSPEVAGRITALCDTAIHTGAPVREDQGLSVKRGAFDNITLEASASAAEINDRKIIQIVLRDITDRQRVEEERLKNSKLDSIGIFAGGISHDFNNLLAIILGYIDLSVTNYTNPNVILPYLTEAKKAVLRSKELTQKFLTFTAGDTPRKKICKVEDIVEDAVTLALSGSNVVCEYHFSEDLWPVNVDVDQMRQVFCNLVVNARESMPDGGRIRIKAGNIDETASDSQAYLAGKKGDFVGIAISDEGRGITPENLPRIFDPYFTTKDQFNRKGLGLGLTIAYSLLKKHGGAIHMESTPGMGTTVNIFLPFQKPSPTIAEKPAEAIDLSQYRILLMDDEEVLRDLLKQMLWHHGYRIIEMAAHGNEAVKKYQEAKEAHQPFDLVILDLTVRGGMGGKVTMGKLLELNPAIKVVIVSGYSSDPVIENYRAFGFAGVIKKPFDMEEIREKLADILLK